MAEYLIQDTTLTGIADAIRAKNETTDPIAVGSFADAITNISTGAVVEMGTFTGNNSSSITISGLTSKKSNIFLAIDTSSSYTLSTMNVISASCINNARTAVYITSYSSSNAQFNCGSSYLTSVTFNTNSIVLKLNTSLKFTAATTTYRWIAW